MTTKIWTEENGYNYKYNPHYTRHIRIGRKFGNDGVGIDEIRAFKDHNYAIKCPYCKGYAHYKATVNAFICGCGSQTSGSKNKNISHKWYNPKTRNFDEIE